MFRIRLYHSGYQVIFYTFDSRWTRQRHKNVTVTICQLTKICVFMCFMCVQRGNQAAAVACLHVYERGGINRVKGGVGCTPGCHKWRIPLLYTSAQSACLTFCYVVCMYVCARHWVQVSTKSVTTYSTAERCKNAPTDLCLCVYLHGCECL